MGGENSKPVEIRTMHGYDLSHSRLPEPVLSIAILCLRKHQIQSQSMHFSKFFWGGMPPNPLEGSCFAFRSVLCTLQVNPLTYSYIYVSKALTLAHPINGAVSWPCMYLIIIKTISLQQQSKHMFIHTNVISINTKHEQPLQSKKPAATIDI